MKKKNIADKVSRLKAIQERLELIPSRVTKYQKNILNQPRPVNRNKVFIVHGHDSEVKETVVRFLKKNRSKSNYSSLRLMKGQKLLKNLKYMVLLLQRFLNLNLFTS